MTDQRIQYTEQMVGANHPTLPDTLNRALLVEHNSDGTHDAANVYQDLITKGPWIDARAYTSLADVDAAAVAAGKLLLISSAWAVVPSTLNSAIRIIPGGKLNATGTVTINGPFEGCAGCIGGNQVVTFGTGAVASVPALWFGVKGDGTTNDAPALNLAQTCANASKSKLVVPAGTYKINSTIVVNTGILEGVGSWTEGSATGASTVFLAGTAGMTMVSVGFEGKIRNLGLQGNNIANIGFNVGGGARNHLEDVVVYRCKKASYVLAKTQNSNFINCFSQYSVVGFTLANGARNNNFFGCTSAAFSGGYNAAAIGVPWANTSSIQFVIDETDADYGGSGVTSNGQDRNSFFGGIYEGTGNGIIVNNLSNFGGAQAANNMFYGVEFDATTIINVTSTPYQANVGTLLMDSGYYGLDTQNSPFTIGTTGNGRITFTGEPFINGGNNVNNRGVTLDSNYTSLFLIDTDNYPGTFSSSGGGSYAYNSATKELTVTGGNNVQGVGVAGPGRGNINNSTSGALMGYPTGFNVTLTFTIKTITGANPVLVYLNLNGSPFRRQIYSAATAGTYTVTFRLGGAENPLDMFNVAFVNNNNTSFIVKGITMYAATGR